MVTIRETTTVLTEQGTAIIVTLLGSLKKMSKDETEKEVCQIIINELTNKRIDNTTREMSE